MASERGAGFVVSAMLFAAACGGDGSSGVDTSALDAAASHDPVDSGAPHVSDGSAAHDATLGEAGDDDNDASSADDVAAPSPSPRKQVLDAIAALEGKTIAGQHNKYNSTPAVSTDWIHTNTGKVPRCGARTSASGKTR